MASARMAYAKMNVPWTRSGAEAVRQDVPERHREVAPAERPRGLDVVELAEAQHGAPDQQAVRGM